jgi:hypothetical protein
MSPDERNAMQQPQLTNDEWILVENALDAHRQLAEANVSWFQAEAAKHDDTADGAVLSAAARTWEQVAKDADALLDKIDVPVE